MTTDMNQFFKAIASRMWKENDLSDMTYALCESNELFKQFFLDFFFKEANLDAKYAKFTREYAVGDSRPDFWIDTPQGQYIVEVKIWDANHHFEQYLPYIHGDATRLGYIAAYKIDVDEKGNPVSDKYPGVRTWKEFHDELKKCVQEEGLGVGDAAIVGYIKFVRSVCGIEESYGDMGLIKSNMLSLMNSMCNKMRAAVRYCADQGDNGFTVYGKSPSCADFSYRKGLFFKFVFEQKDVYGFIGLYFGGPKNNPKFVIGFEDIPGWGRDVCKKYKEHVTTLFENSEWNYGLWFEPAKEILEGTNGELNDYLAKVVCGVCNGDIESLIQNKNVEFADLALLKKAQLFDRSLRKGLLNFGGDVEGRNYEVKYYPNKQTWGGAIGEYFELRVSELESTTWGWVGLIYENTVNKAVIRFRSDWQAPIRGKNEIELCEIKDGIDFSKDNFLSMFKKEIERLVIWMGK